MLMLPLHFDILCRTRAARESGEHEEEVEDEEEEDAEVQDVEVMKDEEGGEGMMVVDTGGVLGEGMRVGREEDVGENEEGVNSARVAAKGGGPRRTGTNLPVNAGGGGGDRGQAVTLRKRHCAQVCPIYRVMRDALKTCIHISAEHVYVSQHPYFSGAVLHTCKSRVCMKNTSAEQVCFVYYER